MTARAAYPLLTREHGSWAVFFVPLFAGAALTDQFSVSWVILVFASLGVFLAHHPLELLLGRDNPTWNMKHRGSGLKVWAIGYLAFGAAWSAVLLHAGFWALVPLAALALSLALWRFWLLRHYGKGMMSDWIGAAGLSLGAPAASYVSTGSIDERGMISWVLCVLFFGSTIVYVRMKIAATREKTRELSKDPILSVGKLNIVYHAGVITLVLTQVIVAGTSASLLIVLVPMAAHALWGTARLRRTTNFKRLGLILIAHSVLFVIMLAVSGKEGILR